MKYKVKSILFLGVGGISMHQLAIAFKKMGVEVFGFDAKESKYTQICKKNNIKITNKFNKKFCKVDICVKTGAIKDNKYIDYLKSKKIPIIDRAKILGWICSKFKNVIAVAGTHGKSTTAALIYNILREAGKKVSCHIGAEIDNAKFIIGDDYLVVEACEYNKSFLKLKPTISVITNIEKEHMDCYKSMFELRNSFWKFLKSGDKRFVHVEKSTEFLKKYNNINFVKNINLPINPKIKGDYNLRNISLAINVCEKIGVDDSIIISSVNSFKGIPRRYEYLGNFKNSKVFVDYAHHPTEIKAFVKTFAEENKNTQIIFQPHTYSRTKFFFKEFVSVLSKINNLIIYKEYAARENIKDGVGAKELYEKLKLINPTVQYCDEVENLSFLLKENVAIAFIGAGDINEVAEKMLEINNC